MSTSGITIRLLNRLSWSTMGSSQWYSYTSRDPKSCHTPRYSQLLKIFECPEFKVFQQQLHLVTILRSAIYLKNVKRYLVSVWLSLIANLEWNHYWMFWVQIEESVSLPFNCFSSAKSSNAHHFKASCSSKLALELLSTVAFILFLRSR
jgi:hypothetical protein